MDKLLRDKVSLTNPWHFLALGFGSGLAPKMPGTFGSLAAIPLVIACSFFPLWAYVVATIFSCIVGVPICGKTADDMEKHDDGSIVWDEIAGMLVAFIMVPISAVTLIAGFLIFRAFDIFKPWPIRWLDRRVHGGFGIMIDDIIAGAMTCLVLHILLSYQIL